MEKTLRILNIVEDTMVDGPGFRTSVYCAGCRHACPGCHNPQSWAFDQGREMTVSEIMRIIVGDPYTRGVTFSGGDPMYQAAAFAELARQVHAYTHKDVWCYTGFTFESLIQDDQRQLLSHVDVLVDGPFVSALRDESLLFRGSANQRLVDVQASLYSGHTVLWDAATTVLTQP